MVIIELSELRTREEMGDLLNKKGLLGKAVEVGTHKGHFALEFLNRWRGESLTCIDPWNVPEGYEPQVAKLPYGSTTREEDFADCQKRLAVHADRVTYLRQMSIRAVESFADRSLDFVYLDGDHRSEQFNCDLRSWFPKVKPEGILAGHDFTSPGAENGGWGAHIQPILIPFAMARGLTINVIIDPGWPSSYFIELGAN